MRRAPLHITDFERSVLSHMARGVPVKAISYEMGVGDKAVSAARRRVLRRNRVDNYLQLGMLIERDRVLA
jgi:DNA-binding NarL/FixJ family response regulator